MSVITFRADPEVDAAIDYLVEASSTSKSQVMRDAVLAAERAERRRQLRAECDMARNDPRDRAEVQAVLAYMGATDAW